VKAAAEAVWPDGNEDVRGERPKRRRQPGRTGPAGDALERAVDDEADGARRDQPLDGRGTTTPTGQGEDPGHAEPQLAAVGGAGDEREHAVPGPGRGGLAQQPPVACQ
jgi:hypothetical protein